MSGPALHVVSGARAAPDGLDDVLDAAYRYALSLTHDASDAEDLVQDAAVKLLASESSWDRAYIFTTVRNRFIDGYRRSRKVIFVALEQEDGRDIDVPDLTWETPDVLESETLERALGSLRTDERETLFLAIVEGYTADEIGRITDRPRGTILSVLHRTKKKLRQLLGGNGGVSS